MIAQLLNGIALGSLYMVLSSGLAMIYGLRGVTNFAHGSLYMAGAYVAMSVSANVSFWVALVAAPIVLAVVGASLELIFFRRLQHRNHIEVGLVTFGLSMILERGIVLLWGEQTHTVSPPELLSGSLSVLGTSYPTYRIFLIVVALVMAAALVSWIRYTRTGLYVRAASRDVQAASVLGINVDRVSLIVVCVGGALAGLAGALAAPYISVSPTMGMQILITVLIVVVVGGAGSLGGAMVAGMALGILQTVGNIWVPAVAALIPFAALVVVLVWRPQGLAGKQA
ncbi:branched-chain amino acid ABC transporter permease [Citricoccus sp. K5]|uniref:branched-chain amino acid ABC transporter permease n=1 Tax=Citricoccus sp. K5 TaxID=2653135 RepID=UPI0012F2BD67|nr:branched-chain amino acid ABC transporter permease [Citricoccus sp. K5]VXA90493.1 Branched-chain amino acid ABC transporter permease [Citricoccus sp. K5]